MARGAWGPARRTCAGVGDDLTQGAKGCAGDLTTDIASLQRPVVFMNVGVIYCRP